ncbi:MAG: hypothetical protein M3Z26_09310 [Bacteroidota bacterium]|nr:hypothetical protein [Bacteroidota bacterium]
MNKRLGVTVIFFVFLAGCKCNFDKKPTAALQNVSYTVPDEDQIQRIAQPSNNTCWAAVATMLWTWKNKSTSAISDVLNNLNNPAFITYFKNDQAINSNQKVDFLESMGLKYEFSSTFTPEFLQSKLQAFGPLWVTTHEGPSENFSFVHARICYGVSGDGTGDGTTLLLIDPDGAKNVVESFNDFITKYQNASGIDIQMVHW